MQRTRAFATLAVVVTAAIAGAVLAAQLSGAFGQINAAATAIPAETSASMTSGTAVATPPVAAVAIGREPGSPSPTTVTSPLTPVDAFLATRAELDGRVPAAATLAPGAALTSTDIANLLATDPQFQSALLDLARDADPDVRREAAEFLAGIEGVDETIAPE